MSRRLWTVILVLFTALAVSAGQPPRPASSIPFHLSAPGAKGAVAFEHLDGGLNWIVGSGDWRTAARSIGYRVDADRLQVVIVTERRFVPEVMEWLDSRGAALVSSAANLIQAHVPLSLLPELNSHSKIAYVRKPRYLPVEPGSALHGTTKMLPVASEGLQAMNAHAWHNAGFTGQGLKVAVIDAGFLGAADLLGSDLPDADRVWVGTFGDADLEFTEHGTGCAEVVYDVAPGLAEMYLFAVGGTDIDIVNAIATAQSYGVHVISMSLGWFTWGPGDGTGIIADAINGFTAAGGVMAVAAGNSRLGHWQGGWNDPDQDGYLDFAHGFEENFVTVDGAELQWFPQGATITVAMAWNQWQSPATDLDLALLWWDGVGDMEVVASSEDLQNGQPGQLPVEELMFEVDEEGYFGVGIYRYSGPSNVEIELFLRPDYSPLEVNIQEGSLAVPSDTAAAITVAAVDAAVPYLLEPYSSAGPTNGPGGDLSGGFTKPDLSGYANVSTAAYGPRQPGSMSFSGTSAACPHVAGAAALAWSAHPDWSNTQLRSLLESRAMDMGTSGMDIDFGHGRLHLGSPPQACSYSISPTSAEFGQPGGSGSVAVATTTGCAWTATSNNPGWIHITNGSSGSGSGTVSYAVDPNPGSARTGTMTIAGVVFNVSQSGGGGGGQHTYLVPGIAHSPGVGASVWRSTLCVTNRSGSPAHLTLVYRFGAGTVTRTYSLSNNGIKEWVDVAMSLFGRTDSTAGSVEISSDAPVTVTARTYNEAAAGTFGQFMPGTKLADTLTYGRTGLLPQIKTTWAFRTNLGFMNHGGSQCNVRVRLFDESGFQSGSTLTPSIAAGRWLQINDVFGEAGVEYCSVGFATIEVLTADCTVWAYASVVDNSTGDPTTVPLVVE